VDVLRAEEESGNKNMPTTQFTSDTEKQEP